MDNKKNISTFGANLSGSNHANNILDKEISSLVNDIYSSKRIPTQEEISKIEKYSGADNTDGVLNAYYTPNNICNFIKKYLLNTPKIQIKYVFEPSFGTGNLLVPNADLFKDAKIYGVEINDIATKIATIRLKNIGLKNVKLFNTSFEYLFVDKDRHTKVVKDKFQYFPEVGKNGGFDIVIGNPPYGSLINYYPIDKKNQLSNFAEHYFMLQSLELLRENGLLFFVIPYGFMCNNNNYNKVKEKILANCDLIDAYRFASKFKDTQQMVDLIILKRKTKVWK